MCQFKVRSSHALGGLAGGQDAMRMDWLYGAFSKKIADKLAALRAEKDETRDAEPHSSVLLSELEGSSASDDNEMLVLSDAGVMDTVSW